MNSSILIELHDKYIAIVLLILINFSEISLTFFCQKNIAILMFIILGINTVVLFYIYLREKHSQEIEPDKIQVIQNILNVIHNKPLQTISYLLKSIQREPFISNQELLEQLKSLNQDIYTIEESLIQLSVISQSQLEKKLKININNNYSIHENFYEIYSQILKRDLVGFANLKIKVRSFDPIENESLTSKQKQQLGHTLALALSDLGTNSQDTTRLKVIGKSQSTGYQLTIKTNGYLATNQKSKEYKLYYDLVQKLGGKCWRQSSKSEGTIYQANFYKVHNHCN